jgi:DNA-binding beta-propeller fold protein YncE
VSAGPVGPAGVAGPKIFISYRREETDFAAGWLFERLEGRFGAQVFQDVDSIEPGDDFAEVITAAVGSCDVLLVLIGDQWLTIEGEDGRRRLDDPDDFVRLEIEAALARDIRVIPILVGKARLPRADELPPSLAKLVRRHAHELTSQAFDTSRLLKVLDKTLAESRMPEVAADSMRATVVMPPELGAAAAPHEAGEPDEVWTEDGEPEVVPTPEPPESVPRPAKRGTRTIVFASVGAIAVAAVAIALLTSGGDDGDQASTPGIPVGDMPVGITVGDGHVWTANRLGASVSMVDPETNESNEIEVDVDGVEPEGVSVGNGSVWVTDGNGDTVTRLSSTDGSFQGTVQVGSAPGDLAIGLGSVWVANKDSDNISRVDLENPDEVTTIPTGQSDPYGVAFGKGDVWVTNRESNTVSRIDGDSGDVIEPDIPVGPNPKGIAVSAEAVWVANTDDGTVTRIDFARGPAPISVGGQPRGVVALSGSIWVTDADHDTVVRLDENGDEIERIPVGAAPESITADLETETVWVANGEANTVTKITP